MGFIDAEMHFYINSFIGVSRNESPVEMHSPSSRIYALADTSQFIKTGFGLFIFSN